uniref:Uncharacterized protein n=1 Tax=Glossina pallidipes TaxID=7398 RepID=A0A1A9ZKQ5_GLOPL
MSGIGIVGMVKTGNMLEVWGGVNTFSSDFGRLKKVSVTTLPLSSSATSLAAGIVSDSEKSQSASVSTKKASQIA